MKISYVSFALKENTFGKFLISWHTGNIVLKENKFKRPFYNICHGNGGGPGNLSLCLV